MVGVLFGWVKGWLGRRSEGSGGLCFKVVGMVFGFWDLVLEW